MPNTHTVEVFDWTIRFSDADLSLLIESVVLVAVAQTHMHLHGSPKEITICGSRQLGNDVAEILKISSETTNLVAAIPQLADTVNQWLNNKYGMRLPIAAEAA